MKKFRPGISFGDFVVHEMSVRKSRVQEEREPDYRKGWLLWLVVVVAFGMIGVRLVQLQLIYGNRYRILADENRIRQLRMPAPRGVITDRVGRILAENRRVTETDESTKLEVEVWDRYYPYGEALGTVVGYTGEVGEEEVGLLKEAGKKYVSGGRIGRQGIEVQLEEELRGIDGGRLVEVDSTGKVAREMGKREPKEGRATVLNIDADLQRKAYEAFAGKKGAAVVSDPQTGEIVVLMSSPGFDPNNLSENYDDLSTNKDLPLFDRAVGGVYPPGSTFKMITSTSALESGRVDPDFVFEDRGVISVGDFRYTNWLYNKGGGVEGVVGFTRAITRSTDTFFYRVGEITGPDEISAWAHRMGLGEKTGIDLPGEVSGLIGDPEWKEKVKGERWFLGNTYHMAIGQGDILVTPIQINLMTNILASGGKKCKLHLIQGENFGEQCQKVPISEETLEIIRQGMIGACSPGGTAFPLFDWNDGALRQSGSASFAKAMEGQSLPVIACKTGTAEYVGENGKVREHGWLTAYAPAKDPKISVTVVVEGGGEGSNVAAPIVRKILAKYFSVEDTYPYSAIPKVMGE